VRRAVVVRRATETQDFARRSHGFPHQNRTEGTGFGGKFRPFLNGAAKGQLG